MWTDPAICNMMSTTYIQFLGHHPTVKTIEEIWGHKRIYNFYFCKNSVASTDIMAAPLRSQQAAYASKIMQIVVILQQGNQIFCLTFFF